MDGADGLSRVRYLAHVASSVGSLHFQSCRSKVDRLHSIISDEVLESSHNELEMERLIASILLHGRSCNRSLLIYINSRAPLPNMHFYSDFRLVTAGTANLSQDLADEQGLILWMLARINPELLLPMPDLVDELHKTGEGYRDLLVQEWETLLDKNS